MKKTIIVPNLTEFPARYHGLLAAPVYDSSCSENAKVWFVDREGGYYLKRAPTLQKEAELTRFFHQKGLAAEVMDYHTDGSDWLLTRAVPGEDCTHYTDHPPKLCDTLAEILVLLHQSESRGCPVADRTDTYLKTLAQNRRAGLFDKRLYEGMFETPQTAWDFIESRLHLLQTDTLLHGDFCLPNVILREGRFSGLIDLDGAGVGDRHIDLFWAIWSLRYNLKTDQWTGRFLDAYGRDRVDEERLRLVAAIERFG
ncbi:MAG: aminoglycoside 3'-phosphotransferase [Clostridia bacterium]|nr:aminoglycoside 3'-phosphotransferase [Clostridia bacterium]